MTSADRRRLSDGCRAVFPDAGGSKGGKALFGLFAFAR